MNYTCLTADETDMHGYGLVELDALPTPRNPVPMFKSYRNADSHTTMYMDMYMDME